MIRDFMVEVYIVHENSVLLIYEPNQNLWMPLSGHMHENELPEEAAVRIAREQLQIEVELIGEREKLADIEMLVPPKTITIKTKHDRHQIVSFVFFAEPVSSHLSNIDFIDAVWFRPQDLNSEYIPEYVAELGLKAIKGK